MSQSGITRAIVDRVRAERARCGWSAQQLEESVRRAGVKLSRSVIANLENRRRDDLSIDEVIGFAQVLGTTVSWLVWGTGVACLACGDKPPRGFTCNECGRSTDVRVADALSQTEWFESYLGGIEK